MARVYATYMLLFLLGNVQLTAGQSPSTTVKTDDFKATFLIQLMKKKLDSIRTEKGVPVLAFDSILYRAAYDQANFLLKGTFSHRQSNKPEKRSPSDRLQYYGGTASYTGENIIMKSLWPDETYGQLANKLVRIWVSSPGHYNNITRASYTVTGLSFVITKGRVMYGVQTFASQLK